MLLGFLYNPFLIFIGLFVIMGAQMESKHADLSTLKGYKVKDVSMKQYISIDAGEPIKQRLIYYWIPNRKLFLITQNEPVGTLNRDQIIVALSEKEKML
jgi:predicted transcriptional regulator